MRAAHHSAEPGLTKDDSKSMVLPAMQAVRKQATLPAIMALTTMLEMSLRRLGAMLPRAPSIRPMDAMFANPHNAYVATTTVRSCRRGRGKR